MISLSFINQDADKLKTQLEELSSHLETYQQAVVLKKTSSGQSRASLTAYIHSLKDTKQLIEKKQLDEASSAIDNLVTSWLAVGRRRFPIERSLYDIRGKSGVDES